LSPLLYLPSVYRLLEAHDLITSPAFALMKAADTFQQPTTAPSHQAQLAEEIVETLNSQICQEKSLMTLGIK